MAEPKTYDEYRQYEVRKRWEWAHKMLKRHHGDQSATARTLKMSRIHLRRVLGFDTYQKQKHYTADMTRGE